MTQDRITSEEKRLWNEQFNTMPQLKEASKRVLNLSRKMRDIMEGKSSCSDFEINEIAKQLVESDQRRIKLAIKVGMGFTQLLYLNPKFHQN